VVDVALIYPFLSLVLILFVQGFFMGNPAYSAELDGFTINTQDKAVTVTLFTDQRAKYTTEHQGKQFTIVLPDTELSKEQIANGLPVVIDNKNRFIGRAVPSEEGTVKIILPNLPANEYAVSIQQKRPGQTGVKPTLAMEKLKPRPVLQAEPESQFEQVAANFPKPRPKKEAVHQSSRLKLSPAPARAKHSGIWNPYVYRPSDFQKTAHKKLTKPAELPTPTNEAVSTVSVAESFQPSVRGQANLNTLENPSTDPLWYLHALPSHNEVISDTLQGPATSGLPSINNNVQPSQPAAPSEIKVLTSEIRKGFQSLPQWLFITAAIFLGGIGLFCLIGGLVLLKVLFKSTFGSDAPANNLPYMTGMMPFYAPSEAVFPATKKQNPTTSGTSRPSYGQTSLRFEDKVSVQAMDYLKGSSSSLSQAIYNTNLVKFPASRKQRSLGVTRKKSAQL
jgi:hypothetical protein